MYNYSVFKANFFSRESQKVQAEELYADYVNEKKENMEKHTSNKFDLNPDNRNNSDHDH